MAPPCPFRALQQPAVKRRMPMAEPNACSLFQTVSAAPAARRADATGQGLGGSSSTQNESSVSLVGRLSPPDSSSNQHQHPDFAGDRMDVIIVSLILITWSL